MIEGKNRAKEPDKQGAHCVKAQIPWEYDLKGRLPD